MRPKPYIGISGVMSHEEMAAIESGLPKCRRPIAFGALISSKTIRDIRNKYPNRYPLPTQLDNIFKHFHEDNLLTLHYSADDDKTLTEDVGLAIQTIGGALDGLQINMGDKTSGRSPNPNKVAAIADVYPHMRIVLQISPDQVDSSAEMWRYVRTYAFSITDVLFDGSCGKGIDFFSYRLNVENMRSALSDLRSSFPHLGLGIAGGLSAATLPQVAELIQGIPDLSIDAEGRLRDKADHLDVGAAIEYVIAANDIVRGS
jgi:hypothetical protein